MTASVPAPDHSAAEETRPINGRCSLASFDQDFIETVIEGLDHYQAMASQVLGNDRVNRGFARLVRDLVYERFRQARPPEPT